MIEEKLLSSVPNDVDDDSYNPLNKNSAKFSQKCNKTYLFPVIYVKN